MVCYDVVGSDLVTRSQHLTQKKTYPSLALHMWTEENRPPQAVLVYLSSRGI